VAGGSGYEAATQQRKGVMRKTLGILGSLVLGAVMAVSPAAHTVAATAIEYGLIAALIAAPLP
jgi:hypothetical protein